MRKLHYVFIWVILFGTALAQERQPVKGWGYGFGSAGFGVPEASTAILHFGGGAAGLLAGGLGAEIDLGYMTPFTDFSAGIGALSPGLLYSFKRDAKTSPFVAGGYSLLFRESTASGFYVAGGVNHWSGERWGFQIGVRDHVLPEYNEHLIGVRFSLLFR